MPMRCGGQRFKRRPNASTVLSAIVMFVALVGCSERAVVESQDWVMPRVSSRDTILIPQNEIAWAGQPTLVTFFGEKRIAAVDSRSLRLYLFNTSGSAIAVIGGEGSGPNQFQSVSDVFPIKPSDLGVWDPLLERLTVVTESGTVRSSKTLTAWHSSDSVRIVGQFANGNLVALKSSKSSIKSRRPTVVRDSVFIVSGLSDEAPKVVVALPPRERLVFHDEGVTRMIPIPASFVRQISICDSGAVFTQDSIIRGINVFGKTLFKLPNFAPKLRTLSTSQRNELIASLANSVHSPAVRQEAASILHREIPEQFSQSRKPIISSNGSIWYSSPKSVGNFRLFAIDGRPQSQLALPPGRVFFQSSDKLAIVLRFGTDSTDAQLELYGFDAIKDATMRGSAGLAQCGPSISY